MAMVGQIVGAMFQSRAQSRATETAAEGSTLAANLQNYQYQQARADQTPYRFGGIQALNQILSMYGMTPYGSTNTDIKDYQAPFGTSQETHDLWSEGISSYLTPSTHINADWNLFNAQAGGGAGPGGGAGGAPAGGNPFANFYASPDFQVAEQRGLSALDRRAAARGQLGSGGYAADLIKFSQDNATQYLGNYFNRLASIAGIGQTATGQTGALGANASSNAGSFLENAGNARASGYIGQGNIFGQLGNSLGNYFGNRSGSYGNYGGTYGGMGPMYNDFSSYGSSYGGGGGTTTGDFSGGGGISFGGGGYSFSDRRLKDDIAPVGRLDNGLTVYRYRYKGDPVVGIGLMADEVEQAHPEAIAVSPAGFLMVDYAKATGVH